MYISVPKKIFKAFLLLILIFPFTVKLFSQPIASFSATPVNGCAPLLVDFTDLSTGNPTSWKWDLGNGTISTLKNPSVTYFASGKYKVTLTVTNGAGSNTVVRSDYINVYQAPVVSFTGTPTSGCLPLAVQFTDNSTAGDGTITSWKWDFGDGVISTDQNPKNIYTVPAIFDVLLQVTNNLGCVTTISQPNYINTANVVAKFNSTGGGCNPPVNLNFQNLSTGPSLSYKWDFGDRATSTLVSPSHPYNAGGSYVVKLTATSASSGCAHTITKNIEIGTVAANFRTVATACVDKEIIFTNTSSPDPGEVTWNFGDGTTAADLNPVKTYTRPGRYTVKMVADFGACTGTITKPITVIAKQNVAFTSTNTFSCKPPLTTTFTSNTPGATSFKWDFGDNTTSTSANPSHTYTDSGSYDVTLISFNASGCSDTLKKVAFITVSPPILTLTDLPLGGCVPFTHTFTSSLTINDPIKSYSWNFGDGTTANTATPTHTFSSIGSYDISLSVITQGGCTASTKIDEGIKAGTKPSANFSAGPLLACAGTYITFTDLSTGNVDEWLWNFGDGRTSGIQNPRYRYTDVGDFDVSLTVRSSGCPSTKTFTKYITIKPPVAKFVIDYNCLNPYNKSFTNNSIGADTWQWDFGDGTTSTTFSPTHTYADTGLYLVGLTVSNNSTGCQNTTVLQVYVINESVAFATNDVNICKGTTAVFQELKSDPSRIAKYTWNFGDGVIIDSNSSTISHNFDSSGVFDVTLTITDLLGCKDALTKPAYITVRGPIAAFTNDVEGGCINTPVTFTDNSISDGTNPIVRWTWEYGDEVTETVTGPPFSYAYSSGGNYYVKLTVTDKNGCTDTIRAPNAIVISEPLADFTTADTASCPLKPITFFNVSSGPLLTYLWNFGDGRSSTDKDPVHQYSATGIYSVSLNITDQYGCTNKLTKNNYVTITFPKAVFTKTGSVSSCPPFYVEFTSKSTDYDSLDWDFGDGNKSDLDTPNHFYYLPGTYTVRLKAFGPGGCFDEITDQILVNGPTGVLSYNNSIAGCTPLTATFNAAAQNNILFTWDFNDGTTVKTTNTSISHTYKTAGFFVPKLILEDAAGCQVPISGTDTIRILGANAGFTIAGKQTCDAGIINFTDTSFSNDPITTYLWDFGDGTTTSSDQNPAHNYTAPGRYDISLDLTTALGCKNSITKPAYASVIASPDIKITRTSKGCVLDTVYYSGIFLKPDTSIVTWKWNLGNGVTSTLQYPPYQIYPASGNYSITATATNSSGCTDVATLPVTITLPPGIDAGNYLYLCQGTPLQLQASGGKTYQWLAPSDFLSCTSCANPLSSTPDDRTYVVRGTNQYGCSALDSVTIKVKKPFNISLSPTADSICVGQGIDLEVSTAEKYLWSPATGISSTDISNPRVFPTVTTTYRVIGYDSANCFKDTAFAKVTVFEYPTVDAGPDRNIFTGESIKISPAYSSDVVKWLWTPDNALSCNNCPAPVISPKGTTTYTVKAENSAECATSDKITIIVNCNNLNLFVPNTFSPNGDGANDIFYPRGTGINRVRGMKVFNRWGQVIFERSNFYANDQSSGWNGTGAGTKLPPDVYTFVIDVICDNGSLLTQTGTITLIR